MFGSSILFLPCLLLVMPTSHGKPVQVDNIKRFMRFISLKIQNEIQEYPISSQVSLDQLSDVVPGNKPIQGLGSIINDLTGFQLILDNVWGPSSAFKVNLSRDFSTLQAHLERKRVSLKCPARTPSSFKGLADYLKENQKFYLSLVPKLLQRFTNYMNLCLSPDTNVEMC